MNDQPTARTAYSGRNSLALVPLETRNGGRVQARAIAEGERLGLPILFHQPRPARSGAGGGGLGR